MLNRFLPQKELESIFNSDQRKELDLILDAVDDNKTIKIIQDEKLLGQLHHAMNLHNYHKSSFRLKLLKHAPQKLVIKFAEKIYPKKSLKNISDSKYRSLVTDLSKLTWGNNANTYKFLKVFDYPEFLIPKSNQKWQNMEIIKGNIDSLPILKEYQSRIFYNITKKLTTPNYRVLIQMPTGSGKTRTAIEIVCHFLNNNIDSTIVWLAESQELLDQAANSFKQIWSQNGKCNSKIYKIWGSDKVPKIKDDGASFVVMGYAKYNSILKKNPSFSINPDLVIVDEAHQILATKYIELLDSLTDFLKGTKVIGLTATPGRGTNMEQNKKLAEQFNDNIERINVPDSIQKIDDDNVIEYLEMQGILSKIDPIPLITNIKFDISNNVWKRFVKIISNKYPDFEESELKTLAKNIHRNALIAQRIIQLLKEKKRILYFGTTSEQTLLMYATILKLGYNAGYVDAKTDKEFRKQFVDKFRNGEIDIIFNHSVFTTGFDAPETNVIFIARPICSPILISQMVGRGLRGNNVGGTKSCLFVQVVDDLNNPTGFDPYASYRTFHPFW